MQKSSRSADEKKKRKLQFAKPLNFYLSSSAGEVDLLTDEVLGELRTYGVFKNAHDEARRKCHLRAILVNIFSAWCGSAYVSLSLARNTYSKRNRYAPSWLSYGITRNLIDGLGPAALGYIEVVTGFRDRTTGVGRNTRIRATTNLRRKFREAGIKYSMLLRTDDEELIRLKNRKKQLVEYTDDANTNAMRSSVRRINSAIEQSFVGLYVPDDVLREEMNRAQSDDGIDPNDEWKEPINFTNRRLYRVFNDGSFERGGRFYSAWWQSVRSARRKHIRVAHRGDEIPSRTREIDYSSMQPSLAYALANKRPPKSAYELPGLRGESASMKPVLKAAMLRMLNVGARTDAIRSLRRYYKAQAVRARKWPPAERIIEQLEQYHSAIRDVFYTNVGKSLMFKESLIAEQVIHGLLEKGIVALPIHDSFLVASQHCQLLEATMFKAFCDVAGQAPSTSIDESEVEYFTRKMSEDEDSGKTAQQAAQVEAERQTLVAKLREMMTGARSYRGTTELSERLLALQNSGERNPVVGMADGDLSAFKRYDDSCKFYWDQFLDWRFGTAF